MPAPAVSVALVDSLPWENELGGGVLRRVEVRRGGRADTIPGVATAEAPVLTAEGRVIGFAYEADAITSAFEYDARTRALRTVRLPEDFHPVFSAPALAPDGRHVAYAVAPGDATGWAVVRTWPGGTLVLQSARVEVPATDSPGNGSRWLEADRFEVFVETGFGTGDAWYRFHGSVARRTAVGDTVRTLPGARADGGPPPDR